MLYTYICDWPHRSKLQIVQAREGFLSCAFRPSTPPARTSCPQRACPAVSRQCPPANASEAPSLRRRKPSLPLLMLMVPPRQRPPRHPQPGMLWSSRRPRLTCIPIPRFKSKICSGWWPLYVNVVHVSPAFQDLRSTGVGVEVGG